MGLDIYLYHSPNYQSCREAEEDFRTREYTIEKDFLEDAKVADVKDLPGSKKLELDNIIEGLRKEYGVDEYGESSDEEQECISLPSEKHGNEHLFKIGYFRSSYNGGGINNQCSRLGVGDLYTVFQKDRLDDDNDGYYRAPDWEDAKDQVKIIIDDLKEMKKGVRGTVSVQCVEIHPDRIFTELGGIEVQKPEAWFQEKMKEEIRFKDGAHTDCQEALDTFVDQHDKHTDPVTMKTKGFGSFSCGAGTFYLDEPIKVKAMIPGVTKHYTGAYLPCVYLVYESDTVDWILSSFEIVEETIDYVLSEGDGDDFYLGWSG